MKRSIVERVWGPSGARMMIGDAVVIGACAAAVIATAATGSGKGRPLGVEVESAGNPTVMLDLWRDAEHQVRGPLGVTRLEVRGGRVRVLSSPCPGQACRHGGWIDEAGEMLVCLPNEVVVRLPGRAPGAPDAVAR